jgi:Leucine-rich repeat (LRR) protein
MINYLNLLDADLVHEKLLSYGLFSEHLDNIFTSEQFGNWTRQQVPYTKLLDTSFSMIEYRLTRNNNAPRILQIPHPIAYARLCDKIKTNWESIRNKILGITEIQEKLKAINELLDPLPTDFKRKVSVAQTIQSLCEEMSDLLPSIQKNPAWVSAKKELLELNEILTKLENIRNEQKKIDKTQKLTEKIASVVKIHAHIPTIEAFAIENQKNLGDGFTMPDFQARLKDYLKMGEAIEKFLEMRSKVEKITTIKRKGKSYEDGTTWINLHDKLVNIWQLLKKIEESTNAQVNINGLPELKEKIQMLRKLEISVNGWDEIVVYASEMTAMADNSASLSPDGLSELYQRMQEHLDKIKEIPLELALKELEAIFAEISKINVGFDSSKLFDDKIQKILAAQKKISQTIKFHLEDTMEYQNCSLVTFKPNNLNKRLFSLRNYNKNEATLQIQLDKQFGKKYQVHADISNFYPSIYTHAIAWAAGGKDTAKTNKKNDKWFNELDEATRRTQRNETMGIPIGPDSSALLAELVLSQVDAALKNYDYVRSIDDYVCYCASSEVADAFLRDLSQALEVYRLKLNPNKTKIISLPSPLNEDWTRTLKNAAATFNQDKYLKIKHLDKISDFIDVALQLYQAHPNDSVLKYMMRILVRKVFVDKKLFQFVLARFFRIGYLYPYVITELHELLTVNKVVIQDAQIKTLLAKEMYKLLQEHWMYRRTDVVLYCIWLATRHEIIFEVADFLDFSNQLFIKRTSDKFRIESLDCLICLQVYEYAKWQELKTVLKHCADLAKQLPSELPHVQDEWWLYYYQLFLDDEKQVGNKKINHDEYFTELKKAGISFIKSHQNRNAPIENLSVSQKNLGLTIFPESVIERPLPITELHLDNNNIKTLPPEINKLQNLRILSMVKNELAALPNEMFELGKLEELVLDGNPIQMLPSNLKYLSNLRILRLEETKLKTLPDEIWCLSKLTQLKISSSELVNIPTSITLLRNLKELFIASKKKSFSFYVKKSLNLPDELGSLYQLQKLTIQVTDTLLLPNSIGELLQLTHLQLEGWIDEIPMNLWHLSNLKTLHLYIGIVSTSNKYKIPREIKFLKQLTEFKFSGASLFYLPQEIVELHDLESLDLSQNHFKEIPNEISQMKQLKTLNMKSNLLEDIKISQLPDLITLNLASNRLKDFPTNLKNLKQLNLRGNPLKNLSASIGQLTNLHDLNLTNCQLTSIPNEIGLLTQLKYLYLGECSKNPDLFMDDDDLNDLFKSFPINETSKVTTQNQLTHLPDSIVNLQNLELLDLRENPIDESELQRIKTLLPKCKILF